MSSKSRPWVIAVTGLSGFVGSRFDQHIVGLNRSELAVVPLMGRDGRSGDIRDARRVSEAIGTLLPDVVLHLAARALPASVKADPAIGWDVNVIGTLNIGQAILSRAPKTRLLYVGSSEAYGGSFNHFIAPLTESAPLEPRSAYGATKAAADLMIGQMAFEGLNAVRFRPFNHTGPGQSADYVVSAFARQVARIERGLQRPVISVGNLDAERDFLDVRDVVAAYALAALPETCLPAGSVMNVATGSPLRIGAMLSALLGMAKQPITVEVDPKRMRSNDIARASGSPDRAKALLGWNQTIPIERTIEDVLDGWRCAKE